MKTVFDQGLSSEIATTNTVSKEEAQAIFQYFQKCPLFIWTEANNDCEDRANAITILLEKWGVPSAKGWVFGGNYLQRDAGQLTNQWKYHVAAVLPVAENNMTLYYVIDPATLSEAQPIEVWADQVTETEKSYYLVRSGDDYIFCPGPVTNTSWHSRNRQNYKWTIQGLAGINGVTKSGQAELIFRKKKIEETGKSFEKMKQNKPQW